MKKILISLAFLAVAAFTAGCGSKEVLFDRLEEARATAKSNAEFNAAVYKAASTFLEPPPKTSGVRVVRLADVTAGGRFTDTSDLSAETKAALLTKGYAVVDRRKEAAAAYETHSDSRLFNPTTSGLYDVVVTNPSGSNTSDDAQVTILAISPSQPSAAANGGSGGTKALYATASRPHAAPPV